jgi:hypothetical protein
MCKMDSSVCYAKGGVRSSEVQNQEDMYNACTESCISANAEEAQPTETAHEYMTSSEKPAALLPPSNFINFEASALSSPDHEKCGRTRLDTVSYPHKFRLLLGVHQRPVCQVRNSCGDVTSDLGDGVPFRSDRSPFFILSVRFEVPMLKMWMGIQRDTSGSAIMISLFFLAFPNQDTCYVRRNVKN